eukprot:scaffold82727_cov63-Phaeocystis_antarctica.AAC.1
MPAPQLHSPVLATWIQGLQTDRTVFEIQTNGGCILRTRHWRCCRCAGAAAEAHRVRAPWRVENSAARPPYFLLSQQSRTFGSRSCRVLG